MLLQGYILRGRCRRRGLSSRPISHIILQYSVLQSLLSRVSIGFALFFRFVMRQPTMTDTCVLVFYHARSKGNPCVPMTCVRFTYIYTCMFFFSGSWCRPCLSKIRCTDPIGDSRSPRVSSERTLPRGTGYMHFFYLSKRLREDLCRRVSEMYLSDLATDWARNFTSR